MGGKMELKKEQSNDNLKYDQLSIELQERIKDDRKQGKLILTDAMMIW